MQLFAIDNDMNHYFVSVWSKCVRSKDNRTKTTENEHKFLSAKKMFKTPSNRLFSLNNLNYHSMACNSCYSHVESDVILNNRHLVLYITCQPRLKLFYSHTSKKIKSKYKKTNKCLCYSHRDKKIFQVLCSAPRLSKEAMRQIMVSPNESILAWILSLFFE